MVITLDNPELEAFVTSLVTTGRFPTAEKAVEFALQLMHNEEDEDDVELTPAQLDRMKKSLADIDAGRTHSNEEVRAFFDAKKRSS